MALSQATLKAELLKIMDSNHPQFVGFPADVAEAAANWAAAYDTYAINAVDYSNDVLTTANPAGFESTLAGALPPGDPGGTAAAAAAAFESAFITYWTGAVFAVGTPPPPTGTCPNVGGNTIFGTELTSVVLTVTPAVLAPLLTSIWAAYTEDPDMAADNAATAFHTATTTAVFVLISGLDTTPPAAGPLPITNTCVIH